MTKPFIQHIIRIMTICHSQILLYCIENLSFTRK